jgi:colanic acid biosynthesis glycosyl transferase WcaI
VPSALVYYHYFYPDDVVSAIHFGDLCAGLVERGWDVTVMPSIRGCRDESLQYPARSEWKGVAIRRIWRPAFRQASALGRLLNIVWMISRWSLAALSPRLRPDVLIIGTDPILSVLVARAWRLFKPRTKIVHWCFDLYPEAALAAGMMAPERFLARTIKASMKGAYAKCDLIVDIGSCMRDRIRAYGPTGRMVTLIPWALEEPDAVMPSASGERVALFGKARLALMYSGNFGRAHSYEDILELARTLRGTDVHVTFNARGNCLDALKGAVTAEDSNISFAAFASIEALRDRLAAPDIHIVSLKDSWTGTVIPSKFFGALAIGRPVLFFGSPSCAVAEWIEQYQIGWVVAPGKAKEVAGRLCALLEKPEEMRELRERCYRVYNERFNKRIMLNRWHEELTDLLIRPGG